MSGSNISGTIPDGSLSSNVALLTGTQTFSGAKTFSSLITANGINDKTSITSGGTLSQGGIYQISNSISTYFSGSYTSYTLNPFTGSPSNVNYSYLVVSSSNTITYTGLVPITIYYLSVGGGGGGGGSGGVLTIYSNASGCGGGGGGGQVLTGSFTLNTSDTITITIGTGGTGGSGAPSNSSTNGSTGNTGVSTVIVKSGTTIATALGGSGGVGGKFVPNSTTSGNGGDGGAGGGGTPAGGAGGTPSLVGNGTVGASSANAGSGSGGSDGQGLGTFQNSGSATTVMQDNFTISGVSVGGFGGYWSSGPNNTPATGYGGGGGGAKGVYHLTSPISGANGNSGVVMLYFFNSPNFQVSNNAITQTVPTSMIYSSLPTFTSSQIGYNIVGVSIYGVNQPITNLSSPTNVITISSVPVGVWLISWNFTLNNSVQQGWYYGLTNTNTSPVFISGYSFGNTIGPSAANVCYAGSIVFNNSTLQTYYFALQPSSSGFQYNGTGLTNCLRIA